MDNKLYSDIEDLIIRWSIDNNKTAGYLTRQIMDLINPPIDEKNSLLDKIGLYETDWIPFDKVIKLKSNSHTILIKKDGKWLWYNNKAFNEIECHLEWKNELIGILKPDEGSIEI